MAKNGELTTKQKRMIAALLSSRNIGDACEAAGVGRSTLTRWLAEKAFTEALQEAEALAMGDAARTLIAGQSEALDTLRDLITNGSSDTVKRQAANDWLTHLFKYRELVDFGRRLAELETEVKEILR